MAEMMARLERDGDLREREQDPATRDRLETFWMSLLHADDWACGAQQRRQMNITRRLDALEVRMAPVIDAEGELYARSIVATDGISYEELIAEGERIMRNYAGTSPAQLTAAIAHERGLSVADVVAEMESIMHAARAWAEGQ